MILILIIYIYIIIHFCHVHINIPHNLCIIFHHNNYILYVLILTKLDIFTAFTGDCKSAKNVSIKIYK